MKTTIDLADDLAATLRKRTASEGISMRDAMHQALRLWLRSQPEPPPAQPIPREIGIFSGDGLTREAASLSWDEIRSISHER